MATAPAATSAARVEEAERLETAMQWAIAEIGAGVIQDSLAAWAKTPTNTVGDSYKAYANSVKRLVQLRRSWMVELAVAYYRLVRALRTGKTVPGPVPDARPVTVETLRRDFDVVLDEIQAHVGSSPKPTIDPGKRPAKPAHHPEDDVVIEVDDFEDDFDWDDMFDEVDQEVDDQLDELLDTLGRDNFDKKLKVIIDEDRPASEVDKERRDAHDKVGRRTAAEWDRITRLYIREGIYRSAEHDKLAIGWVRYSTTGTPCGFCAMLISREIFYKTRVSAADPERPDMYHTNCQCRAIPVFSREQFDNSPLFNLNREYNKLWPKVTQGLGGKDALTEWRRYFRQQQKKQDKTTVPEAA